MSAVKRYYLVLALAILVFTFCRLGRSEAKGGDEYGKVVNHLKTKYRAKKVKSPVYVARAFCGRRCAPGRRQEL